MQRATRQHDPCTPRSAEPIPAILRRGAWWMILAGLLVFAHGCHRGDHDDELFAWITSGCEVAMTGCNR